MSRSKWSDGPKRAMPAIAGLFCFLFGLALIANIHPIGDGLWFWYAMMTRGGARLYTDLHFNLQPFFVLLTSAGQLIFGIGWLASKVVPSLQLLAYVLLLYFVVQRVPWRPWQRAVLLLASFGVMVAMTFFRFDDYHITTNLFEMASIALLLREQRRETYKSGSGVALALLLGLLAGLSTANRLNDGASLLVANGIAFAFTVRGRTRVAGLAVLVLACVATLLGTVLLTGDSFAAWSAESIVNAARIKGGTDSILLIPFTLPLKALHLVRSEPMEFIGIVLAAFLVSLMLPVSVFAVGVNLRRRWPVWLLAGFVFLAMYPLFWLFCRRGGYVVPLCNLAIIPAYGLALWIGFRLLSNMTGRTPHEWRPAEALFLLPFLQMLSAAATAGATMPMSPPALATMLLLLPISCPGEIRTGPRRQLAVGFACFIALVAFPPKVVQPYGWHFFTSGFMFHDRTIYRHPTLGPMVIENPQRVLAQSFCDHIARDGAAGELLSLPYPYLNYFCGIAPWHGYVQTWFDTSSKETIDHLDDELQTHPPKWIVYERLLPVMDLHERVFNRGRPLPHRALDNLIVQKVARGEWKIADVRTLNGGSWFLIQTRS